MSVASSASIARRSTEARRPATLGVAGLVPLTTTDFPGQLAAVLFCQGCPWRCGYCHNPHLIPARGDTMTPWAEIRAFLQRRRGLLDAVVFSGGEPLYQRELEAAVSEVADLGFAVGLHTGGAWPERLATLLPKLDWVGLDIKAAFDDYERVTRVPGSGARARASLQHLLHSGVPCEVRTTVHPRIFTPDDLLRLARDLASMGVRRYALQAFRATGCADATFTDDSANDLLDVELSRCIGGLFDVFEVRGAKRAVEGDASL